MIDSASQTLFGWSPLWVASTILVLAYAVIIMDWVHRAIVALLGAALVIGLGILTQDEAIRGIDFNTLGLLTGMMVLVILIGESGLFQFLAIKGAKLAKGSPWGILVMLSCITALISAFLNNVTVVLLIAPVTFLIADELRINPYPFLFAEINASNTGGTATLIGDPPNIMIGSAAGLPFNAFIVHLTPLVLLVFVATLAVLWVHYGRHMKVTPEAKKRVMTLNEYASIKDGTLLLQCGTVFGLVTVGFVFAEVLRLELATIALSGAGVLLLLTTYSGPRDRAAQKVQEVLSGIDWTTIFFFLGLFIIVTGVEHAGLLKRFAQWILSFTGGDFALITIVVLWASAVLSALLDNIPFVVTMIPVIKDMVPVFETGGISPAHMQGLWWALAAGACLGGNGTLIGAAANLVVAGLAEQRGVPFGFLPFLKVAFPIMLLQIGIASIYIWWRYL